MRVLQSTPHVLKQELQQEGMGEICPKGVGGGGSEDFCCVTMKVN